MVFYGLATPSIKYSCAGVQLLPMIQHIISDLCRQTTTGPLFQCRESKQYNVKLGQTQGLASSESKAIVSYLCPKVQGVEAVVWEFDTAKVPAVQQVPIAKQTAP